MPPVRDSGKVLTLLAREVGVSGLNLHPIHFEPVANVPIDINGVLDCAGCSLPRVEVEAVCPAAFDQHRVLMLPQAVVLPIVDPFAQPPERIFRKLLRLRFGGWLMNGLVTRRIFPLVFDVIRHWLFNLVQ